MAYTEKKARQKRDRNIISRRLALLYNRYSFFIKILVQVQQNHYPQKPLQALLKHNIHTSKMKVKCAISQRSVAEVLISLPKPLSLYVHNCMAAECDARPTVTFPDYATYPRTDGQAELTWTAGTRVVS